MDDLKRQIAALKGEIAKVNKNIDEFKKQTEELKKEIESLKIKRIYQQDIMPSSVKPRALVTDTMEAGDLFYSDGNNFVKIPIGTTGQVLKVVAGIPTWTT